VKFPYEHGMTEIERLTAQIEEWKRRYETARLAHEEGRTEIARLNAEIKRLNWLLREPRG
jgi:hypothetical protein